MVTLVVTLALLPLSSTPRYRLQFPAQPSVHSHSLAYGLTDPSGPTLPLRKGDTVLFFSPNSIAYPVVTFGIVAAGLRCTFSNSAYTANELKHQWTDSGAKVIFAHPSLVPTVTEMFKNGLGWKDEEVRRRVIVASAEWLTGAKDEGIPLSLTDASVRY